MRAGSYENRMNHAPVVFTLPGWGSSPAAHWQSRWEATHPHVTRVHQEDWERPDAARWTATVEAALDGAETPVVLAAHSMGCLVVARLPARVRVKVRGALLVAPPDTQVTNFPSVATGFVPVPRLPLPFPSIVVASTNDPYASLECQQALAQAWGSRLVNVGDAGHINSASGLGLWGLGWALVQELAASSAAAR